MGIMFSGIFTGLVVSIGALSFGLPLWVAVMLYPILGTMGAIGFIGFVLSRKPQHEHEHEHDTSPVFAAE
ncbi:hypothetical protein [Pseudorhodobacter ferrugineus]|nr:hypothetical protein [Pseudorhodobacter ferrugineus]